jgi:vacuolar-type H+-ATPase subunit I/STV1
MNLANYSLILVLFKNRVVDNAFQMDKIMTWLAISSFFFMIILSDFFLKAVLTAGGYFNPEVCHKE